MATPPSKEQSQQDLKHELRDVISILTGLGKNGGAGANDAMGIITLAGTNRGAMMKMEGPEAAAEAAAVHHNPNGDGTEAYANSNYQSINNSIVIGGSCGADDPGIHLRFEDYLEETGEGDEAAEHHEKKSKEKKHEEKKKEKGKRGKSEDETVEDE